MFVRLTLISIAALMLAGCEIPGVYPDPKIAQREADAKATGGGCRHAMRGIEDCYTMNPKAPRAAVFTGWKEMDQYMRENKIAGTPSSASAPDAEESQVASTKEKAAPEAKERRSGKANAS